MLGHVHAHAHGEERRSLGSGRRERAAERRGLLLTLFTTTTILVAEVIGGWLSNSLALLADAGHMLSDSLALALAFLALKFAAAPATPEKTYGWYRLEILAALVNGVSLVVIAGFIFWESWERLLSPPEVRTGLMMAVAGVGLAANALGLFFLSGHHDSLNVRGAYLHVLGDLLSSIGVLVGGAVMWWTAVYWIDPAVSAAIGVVIVISAWRLVRESVDVLLEATPAGISYEEVSAEIVDVEGIEGVHDLHIWSLTSGVHALSCHVEVKPATLARAEPILDALRHVLRERFDIDHTTIQIEPEGYASRQTIHWRLQEPENVR